MEATLWVVKSDRWGNFEARTFGSAKEVKEYRGAMLRDFVEHIEDEELKPEMEALWQKCADGEEGWDVLYDRLVEEDCIDGFVSMDPVTVEIPDVTVRIVDEATKEKHVFAIKQTATGVDVFFGEDGPILTIDCFDGKRQALLYPSGEDEPERLAIIEDVSAANRREGAA